MLPSIAQMRLQQLEDNVVRVLRLLNDYEVELLDELDPATRSKYHRHIENLKQQRDNYEKELIVIQNQLSNEQSAEQVSIIVGQLQEIDSKLNWLANSQVSLHQIVLAHFTTEEKALIEPVAKRLEEAQIIEVELVLETIESNRVTEEEANFIVAQLQQVLVALEKENFALPSGNEAIVKALNYPTLDTKHALKVSIPIIPFILSYEGELGLGAGVKIREAWDRWKSKLSNQ